LSDTSDSVDGQITDDKLDFILKHSTQRYDLVSSGKLDVNKLLKEVVNLKSDILATEKGKCPRTIMVTSSVEGEGKTTTAIAMARSLANDSADKVLIISANSGKHALNRLYELDNEKIGFLELLSGAASMQDTVIHKTDLEQLDIMSCGKSGKVSTKNFDTDQLERLLDTLKNHYDFVIVDAPSILTSSSISLFMAQSFDGLVVVVRCNKTKKELVQKTVKTIEVLGANIIGVILNNKSNYIPRWLYNWI
jgi:capsular exopolysaccharide synthesis family protein